MRVEHEWAWAYDWASPFLNQARSQWRAEELLGREGGVTRELYRWDRLKIVNHNVQIQR